MAGALIGALRVSLSAETSAFEAGMKKSQRVANQTAGYIRTRFGNVGASLKAGFAGLIAGLSIGVITRAISSSLEYAGSLAEVAQQLGVTTRDLQVFRFAAGQVGVSQEQLETGLSKLTITLGKIALGAKEPAKAFQAIGISVDQLKGKDTGQVFRLMADALEKVKDRSQRAAFEVAAMGKSGSKLDNLLAGGSRSLNELADAADRLGIVLSDEQIQKADQAADKLEAVKTVISANIAGVVADNADAIVELANAFGQLVASLAQVGGWLVRTGNEFGRFAANAPVWAQAIENALNPIAGLGRLAGAASVPKGSSSVTTKLPGFTRPATGNANIGKFLAPSRGGGRGRKERDTSLRDAFQFDQDIRRAQQDILRAQQNLAANYIERTTIGIEILNAEKEAFEAELVYKVKAKELTQAQADQLLAAFNKKDALERQALLEEEQAQKAEDIQQLTQHDFDRRRDTLEAAANIAETAEERRKIELELLQIAYEQKRQALQNIIDTSKDIAAIEDARRDLLNLKSTFGSDRQSVINSTRGPMEQFVSSLPDTAAKVNEALQSLEVEGFQGLIDAAGQLSNGFGAVADSLLDTLKNFIAGLLQLQLQRGLASILGGGGGSSIFGAFGSLFGGSAAGATSGLGSFGGTSGLGSFAGSGSFPLLGFASGGAFSITGRHGIDRNVMSLNGLPIARVSYGERVNIGNDNKPMGGGFPSFVFNNYAKMSTQEARATGMQAAAAYNAEMARSRNKGIS